MQLLCRVTAYIQGIVEYSSLKHKHSSERLVCISDVLYTGSCRDEAL